MRDLKVTHLTSKEQLSLHSYVISLFTKQCIVYDITPDPTQQCNRHTSLIAKLWYSNISISERDIVVCQTYVNLLIQK